MKNFRKFWKIKYRLILRNSDFRDTTELIAFYKTANDYF